MLASPVLPGGVLADSTRLGDASFLAIGPAVIFVAVVLWVAVTLMASREPPRAKVRDSGLPHRGPVQGGVIAGSPSQRNRRDPAPSVTRREALAHVERGRVEERARSEPERRSRRFGLRKPR